MTLKGEENGCFRRRKNTTTGGGMLEEEDGAGEGEGVMEDDKVC